MTGEERRGKIVEILRESGKAIPGTSLAKMLNVSRQIIVSDMALLRAGDINILSTHKGYIMESCGCERVFKVKHSEEEVEEELNLFVDFGGRVKDVFVYHKMYDIIKVDMNIKSRMDVKKYLEGLKGGKSTLLMNVTGGYHYHTIEAESEEILDIIQEELNKKGFLAKLQDYEPVDFWKES